LGLLLLGWTILYLKSDRRKYSSLVYNELTIMLGSGGHTGEICELLKNFHFEKVQVLNVLMT
jgi:hypothetical protein